MVVYQRQIINTKITLSDEFSVENIEILNVEIYQSTDGINWVAIGEDEIKETADGLMKSDEFKDFFDDLLKAD